MSYLPEDEDDDDDEFDEAKQQRQGKLRAAVLQVAKLLGDKYLWQHRAFRERVASHTDGIPLGQLAHSGFGELAALFPDEPVTGALLAEAFRMHVSADGVLDAGDIFGDDQLPTLVMAGGAGAERVRRRAALDLSRDPDLRTVFVRPIRFTASDIEIDEFFGKWGTIVDIQRREWIDRQDDKRRRKPGVFIVFNDVASAQKCAEEAAYPVSADPGRFFIPTLQVAMKKSEEETWADEGLEGAKWGNAQRKRLKLDDLSALQNEYVARAIPSAAAEGGAAAAPRLSGLALEFLQPGHVLRISGLAADVQWRDVRQFLQKDLGFKQGRGKSSIAYTHFDQAARRAFVILKKPDIASAVAEKQAAAPVVLKGGTPVIAVADAADLATLRALGGPAPVADAAGAAAAGGAAPA